MNKYTRNDHHQHQHQSINACELLKALNTLQQHSIAYEEELSFGQPCRDAVGKQQNHRHLEFQIYMEKKVKPTTGKENSQHCKVARKSATPLKDMTRSFHNHTPHSHTPKKSVSPMPMQTKYPLKQNKHKNTPSQQVDLHNTSSSKMSHNTRKILTQKQKKGKIYVPIQHRAEQLLKQRQVKLAKIKKEKQFSQMLEEKQCTFKPKLTKNNFAKSQVGIFRKNMNNRSKIQEVSKLSQVSRNDEESSRIITQKTSCHQKTLKITKMKTQPLEETKQPQSLLHQDDPSLDQTLTESTPHEQIPDHPATSTLAPHKKYKNDKFNILLDLLH